MNPAKLDPISEDLDVVLNLSSGSLGRYINGMPNVQRRLYLPRTQQDQLPPDDHQYSSNR